jgi:hypothetical protein
MSEFLDSLEKSVRLLRYSARVIWKDVSYLSSSGDSIRNPALHKKGKELFLDESTQG